VGWGGGGLGTFMYRFDRVLQTQDQETNTLRGSINKDVPAPGERLVDWLNE